MSHEETAEEQATELVELRAEVERLRADVMDSASESEMRKQNQGLRERAEQAEARLLEETKAQDEVVALLHKQIEDLEARLREVDVALRDSGLVLFQPTGGKLCVLRLKASAQPEEKK